MPKSNINAPTWTVNAFTENPPKGGITQIQVGYYNGGKRPGFLSTPFSYGVSVQVQETFGRVYLTFNRMYGRYETVRLSYTTIDGTAIAGVDYTAVSGNLTWTDTDISSKTVQVPLLQTSDITNKYFTFRVVANPTFLTIALPAWVFTGGDINTSGNYATFKDGTVTILRQGRGTLNFVGTPYSVARPGGTTTVTLQVQRFTGFKGAVGCSWHTTNGTALSGTAYTGASGTLSWADGEGGTKNIVITILNGGSGTQSFTVTIDTPTGGVSIGSTPTATVNIVAAAPPANPVAGGSVPQQTFPLILPSDTSDDAYVGNAILQWRRDALSDDATMYWRQNILYQGMLGGQISGGFIGFGPAVDSFGKGTDVYDYTESFVPPTVQNKFQISVTQGNG